MVSNHGPAGITPNLRTFDPARMTRRHLYAMTGVVLIGVLGCADGTAQSPHRSKTAGVPVSQASPDPERPIQEVLGEKTAEWLQLPGVVGTAVGLCDGKPCIKVYIAEASEQLAAHFPERVEGHRVELHETGEFRKYSGD